MENTKQTATSKKIIPYFLMTDNILYYVNANSSKVKISQAFEVIARASDKDNRNYMLVVKFTTLDNVEKVVNIPAKDLYARDSSDILQLLANEGFIAVPNRLAKIHFLTYLCEQNYKCSQSIKHIDTIGWYNDTYVLPDSNYPPTDKIKYSGTDLNSFASSGTLEEWQSNIGKYLYSNTRLLTAVGIALSAPLLKILNGETTVYHFFGPSSRGKTVALRAASNIWGGSDKDNDFTMQWRGTDNGTEAVAQSRNDSLLAYDEFDQFDIRKAKEVIYMLGNNKGKTRLSSSGAARKSYKWRLNLISTGESSLEDRMRKAKEKPMAGMEMRFLSIPATCKYGIYDNTYGLEGAELSVYLKDAFKKNYGIAGESFLQKLVQTSHDYINERYQHARIKLRPKSDVAIDGQIQRVVDKFAVVLTGLELAIEFGVLLTTDDVALNAVHSCFNDWFENRDNAGGSEEKDIIEQARNFLLRYSDTRFEEIPFSGESRIRGPLAGYKKQKGQGYEYCIITGVFKDEICQGYNPKVVADVLIKAGILAYNSNNGKRYKVINIGSGKKASTYVFTDKVFCDEPVSQDNDYITVDGDNMGKMFVTPRSRPKDDFDMSSLMN